MDEDARAAGVLSMRMETSPAPERIVVDVTPRLLADALVRLLSDAGLDVLRLGPGGVPPGNVAVAIVTSTSAATARLADVVVELGSDPDGHAAARVTGVVGTPVVTLDGVSTIIDFVRRSVQARASQRSDRPV